jgi:hypothetical protein
LLADEVRPAIAAAAGVAPSEIRFEPERGSVKATVELPWVEGEDAKALSDRALVTARALGKVAAAQKSVWIHLRIGKLDFEVVSNKREEGEPYIALHSRGIWLSDPAALPLVMLNPTRSSTYGSSNEALTGSLENTGPEPTPPIEVFTKVASGYGAERKVREVSKKLGSIAPGKRVRWSLSLMDVASGGSSHAMFRADGKRIEVLNKYAHDHSMDWLNTALGVRASHGVWADHAGSVRREEALVVHLTAEQAALPEGEREGLFLKIAKALKAHRDRYHRDEWGFSDARVTFEAPSGGGWRFEEGKKKSERFERGGDKKKL